MNIEPACKAAMEFLKNSGFMSPRIEGIECIGEVLKVDFSSPPQKAKSATKFLYGSVKSDIDAVEAVRRFRESGGKLSEDSGHGFLIITAEDSRVVGFKKIE